MGKPKGSQKTGGRKKGCQNKKSRFLNDELYNLGFDTSKKLVELYNELPPNLKLQMILKIIDHAYVKPVDKKECLEDPAKEHININLNYKL